MLVMLAEQEGQQPVVVELQMDRRGGKILDAEGVRRKYGVDPAHIPDFLALVGDSSDGYPGISRIGRVTAARLVQQYGAIEQFPPTVLGEKQAEALLFKKLATLRTDAPLFKDVEDLRWRGPTGAFAEIAAQFGAPKLIERARRTQPR